MKAFTRTLAALVGTAALSLTMVPAAGAAMVPAYHHGHGGYGYGGGYGGYYDGPYDDYYGYGYGCGCGDGMYYYNGTWYSYRGDALAVDPYRHHNSD